MSPMPAVPEVLAPLIFIAMFVTPVILLLGVPLLMFVAIRFLWYRHIYIGRSAELEKLVWQLHPIASALETRAVIPPTDVQPTPESRSVSMSMFGRPRRNAYANCALAGGAAYRAPVSVFSMAHQSARSN